MEAVAAAHGIGRATGYRWRRDRAQFGDRRRVRKRKAEAQGRKLGRPFRVPSEQLQCLLNDEENPVQDAPIPVQQRINEIPLCPWALRYNLSNCEDAHMYVAAYSYGISASNKRLRVRYGHENKDREAYGYWDLIYFTDEAHFNLTESFQKPYILRRRSKRLEDSNIRTRNKRKATSITLHMYATVNWYFKSPLGFYNDEKDMLKAPKLPPKPRKSKY
ncbi:hypothetical protein CC86DRAFT_323979 [Ophiobolus disseminans]|uniref:Uncharacterized protein n=1 Tax=Ophiobolus disseminans TaxID=1469910 RepID=A0A6A6ZWV7_9PLEO|nr:hypothetical protein CC86DRAFT_323979 [Ophiobolus disseminans]